MKTIAFIRSYETQVIDGYQGDAYVVVYVRGNETRSIYVKTSLSSNIHHLIQLQLASKELDPMRGYLVAVSLDITLGMNDTVSEPLSKQLSYNTHGDQNFYYMTQGLLRYQLH